MRFGVGETVLAEGDLDGEVWVITKVVPEKEGYHVESLSGDHQTFVWENELRIAP